MYLFLVVLKRDGYSKIVPETEKNRTPYHGPNSDVRVFLMLVDKGHPISIPSCRRRPREQMIKPKRESVGFQGS